MADALVSMAQGKLNQVLMEQVELFAGAAGELRSLKNTFESIEALLADAESRQVAEKNVHLWLSRLRQVAYEIELVMDEWGVSDEGSCDLGIDGNKVCGSLSFLVYFAEHVFSRYKVARHIKEIKGRLDWIAADRNNYQFSISSNSLSGGNSPRPQTSSLMEESEMIGRGEDKETVISRLVSETSSGSRVQVIAVVGMGGLGKTTLAQEVFNDGRVQHHFKEALYWVWVSDVFDEIRLIKAIIQEVKGQSCSLTELNSLQIELVRSLEEKSFLLVLDDVWNDEYIKWKNLWLPLKKGGQGSKILITTRTEAVAKTMKAAYTHNLEVLSDNHAWMLFSSRAFYGKKPEECSELESIGRQLVGKCKGVPLPIKVLGSTMNSRGRTADWQKILEDNIWSLPAVENEILPALLFSYCCLPAHLKQCFAYCSIYQKGTEMVKDEVVRLWVAQGFIQLQGTRELDDIGEEYFDDLVAWSMFQQVERSETTIYIMHDLLHDLAGFVVGDEHCFFMSGKSEHCSANVRHASLVLRGDFPIASLDTRKLRSFFLSGRVENEKTLTDFLHQARFLRALQLSSDQLAMLKPVGKMKYLRYLSLSGSNITELPKSVCDLCHLHTLNLNSCLHLEKLPKELGRMVTLKHLEIEKTPSLERLPPWLGRIHSLRTLSKFIVTGEEGCGIAELQQLNSLRGSLEITNLDNVLIPEEARKAELCNKPHLRRLHLCCGYNQAEAERMNNVLECLRPHSNLKELVIESDTELPSWIGECSSLSKLKIWGLTQSADYPHSLGRLCALKSLELGCVGFRKMGHKFPKLEWMVLACMSELVEWEEADAAEIPMPALRRLSLTNCPNLRELPPRLGDAPLTELFIRSCDRLMGTGYSFPHLENFLLSGRSRFFSNRLPDLPKLKNFTIRGINNETLPDEGWEQLVALQKVRISGCVELKSLPNGLSNLPSLQSFSLFHCIKLKTLGNFSGQLKNLKMVDIKSMDSLTHLPDSLGQLELLETLVISNCVNLRTLPEGLGRLKKLKSLTIERVKAWNFLCDSVAQLVSLEKLSIGGLGTLASLPDSLGQLKALKELHIYDFEKLALLPHWLQDLSLKKLEIINCPLLLEKCKREEGEDWPKISRIPMIKIDRQRI